jgi:hypothetical protein
MPRSPARLAALLVGAFMTIKAAAATVEMEANAGFGRSDNLARTPQDEQDATLKSVGLDFSLLHATRRIDADLVGDLRLIDYSGNLYSSELTGSAAGRLSLGLVDESLRWIVEDSFGQTRRDVFSVPTPENREDVNFFSTGPDVRLRLGDAMSLLLGARYSRVDYESSPADAERTGGWIATERELANSARFGIHVTHERVDPRGGSATPTYDRSTAYLRYELAGSRTSVAIDIGANRVHGNELDEAGALLRMELARAVGRYSRVTFRAGEELTDSGSTLRPPAGGQLPPPSPGTDSLLQSVDPFTARYVELGWAITGRRTALALTAGWSRERCPAGTEAPHGRAAWQPHAGPTHGSIGGNPARQERLRGLWRRQ